MGIKIYNGNNNIKDFLIKSKNYNTLIIKGPFQWGSLIQSEKSGVYLVCLDRKYKKPPFNDNIINGWLANKTVSMLKTPATITSIKAEMTKFWLEDEIIVYIGKSARLDRRIYQFYGTPIGANGPHRGGYWIKVLDIITSLNIYFIEYVNHDALKLDLLLHFSKFGSVHNPILFPYGAIPFANLELKKGQHKGHTIRDVP